VSWRLKINHVSGYRYRSTVSASYNEARITPLTTDSQTTIDARVDVEPVSRPFRYWDYWGTLVHAFDVHTPHTELVVTGSSVVETDLPQSADPDFEWEGLTDVSEDLCEYLGPTRYVPLAPEIVEIASEFRHAATPRDAAVDLCGWVHSAMAYQPGSTAVSTSASEALATREGVCQDFVHVYLGVARALGVPCRYVSGYLHPSFEPVIGRPVKGQSHAWAQVWVGEWVALDPTSGEFPGLRHVEVARGRDYRDVAPLTGIYSGGAAHALEVEVELTRVS